GHDLRVHCALPNCAIVTRVRDADPRADLVVRRDECQATPHAAASHKLVRGNAANDERFAKGLSPFCERGLQSFIALQHYSARRAPFCRDWCTKAIAMLPSPTAAATRLTGLSRTSPHAKMPGTLVSRSKGSRSYDQRPDFSTSSPVST